MTLEQAHALLEDRPRLHQARDGTPKDGGLSRVLGERFITEISPMERPRIAETGTGLSTLLFLSLDPAEVISISPAPDLHERTKTEAIARGIDLTPARFINARSEACLPILALVDQLELDVAFIDGNHGWPAVFVDFCYLNRMLRPGGLLFVDDIQIYAVAQLVCLLKVQRPHYDLVAIDRKMATFRKGLDLHYLPDWTMEPFIMSNTAEATSGFLSATEPG